MHRRPRTLRATVAPTTRAPITATTAGAANTATTTGAPNTATTITGTSSPQRGRGVRHVGAVGSAHLRPPPEQVPPVAGDIEKHGDLPERLIAGLPDELDPAAAHARV